MLSGVVYGALLNHRPQWVLLGEAAHRPPYGKPAQSPVLAVRPRHMLVHDGARVVVPSQASALEVGASLGIVVARMARQVPMAEAMSYIAGYTVAMEIGIPCDSHYRPAARLKARDGFCPISQQVIARDAVNDPDALTAEVLIDGIVAQSTNTQDRLRNVAQLLVDVTAFMTLQTGDVLLLGASAQPPLATAGQTVEVRIAQVGSLHVHLVHEETRP